MRRTLATALPLCLLVLSCSHLAQAFGPDEGLDSAKAILDLGIQYYNEKRYSQAIAQYQKVLSDFPGTEYVAEAQFRIANVYHWGIKEPEEALVAYQTVVDNYPDSQFARTALVRMGSIIRHEPEIASTHSPIPIPSWMSIYGIKRNIMQEGVSRMNIWNC